MTLTERNVKHMSKQINLKSKISVNSRTMVESKKITEIIKSNN